MNYLRAVLTILILATAMTACTQSAEEKGRQLLEKALLAHGGIENWEKVTAMVLTRSIQNYDEAGKHRDETIQKQEFRLIPYFEAKITWTKDSLDYLVSWDASTMRYRMGENEIKNESFLTAKKVELDESFAAVAMPWVLRDAAGVAAYQGQDTLDDGQLVEVLQVSSGFKLYLDPVSFKVLAKQTEKKGRTILTFYQTIAEDGKLVVLGEEKSYQLAENGEREFVVSASTYSELKINYR